MFTINFLLDKNFDHLKKWHVFIFLFYEHWLIIQGVKNILFNIRHNFCHFWRLHQNKMTPLPQISFKSWVNKVAPDYYIFVLKSVLRWLEKVSFQTAWASPKPWTKLSDNERILYHFLRSQRINWRHITQFSCKSWLNNADYDFFLFSSFNINLIDFFLNSESALCNEL